MKPTFYKLNIDTFLVHYNEYLNRYGEKPDHVALTKKQAQGLLEDYYGDLEKPELEFTEMLGLPIWFSNMPCNDPICIFGRWVR